MVDRGGKRGAVSPSTSDPKVTWSYLFISIETHELRRTRFFSPSKVDNIYNIIHANPNYSKITEPYCRSHFWSPEQQAYTG